MKLADEVLHPLNTNSNVLSGSEKLTSPTYTAGQMFPEKSEFKQVLKRRKSRLSTEMHNTVDFEMRGHAPFMNDFIKKDNKYQLSYELNLRNYKPISDFKAEQPWQYPSHKSFKPSETLANFRLDASLKNYDPVKNKFIEKFDEPNSNLLVPMEKHTTVYQNVAWPASLRGDRKQLLDLRKQLKRQSQKKTH